MCVTKWLKGRVPNVNVCSKRVRLFDEIVIPDSCPITVRVFEYTCLNVDFADGLAQSKPNNRIRNITQNLSLQGPYNSRDDTHIVPHTVFNLNYKTPMPNSQFD